jgi:isopentenyl diphosphate isomerase/L-lactate dehydrogenase-like FMN-dependent dehydrogenase
MSFKIFIKVMVNRMTGIPINLINPSQVAFMPGRNIMERVVMLHEAIHEIHRKKMSGSSLNWISRRRTIKLIEIFYNKLQG